MITYKISYQNANTKTFQIECLINTKGKTELILGIPKWRLGRYGWQNFSAKIIGLEAKTATGDLLEIVQTEPETWQINNLKTESVLISYNFYANTMDAGNGCWLSEDLIYINPGTCLLYELENLQTPCQVIVSHPKNYRLASSLKPKIREENEENEDLMNSIFIVKDYHLLADSPIIFGQNLQHFKCKVKDLQVNLWFKAMATIDGKSLVEIFKKFINYQIEIFGDVPKKSYSFLFIFWHLAVGHGLEHGESCTIVCGPELTFIDKLNNLPTEINNPNDRNLLDFLNVASHEFFHFWNVKYFFPKDLESFDFRTPILCNLHWLTEGFTSYYADKALYKSGVYSLKMLASETTRYLQYYSDNLACSNLSLSQSSLDSFTEGYGRDKTPGRTTSFYLEGGLVAFLMDLEIQKLSGGQLSLDDFMRQLYQKFSPKNGYTEADLLQILEDLTGKSWKRFFTNYIHGRADLISAIDENLATSEFNLELKTKVSPWLIQKNFGLKIDGQLEIKSIWPNSVGQTYFSLGDRIVSINGTVVRSPEDLQVALKTIKNSTVNFEIIRLGFSRQIEVENKLGDFFKQIILKPKS